MSVPLWWKLVEVTVRERVGERTTWIRHDQTVSDHHHSNEFSNQLYIFIFFLCHKVGLQSDVNIFSLTIPHYTLLLQDNNSSGGVNGGLSSYSKLQIKPSSLMVSCPVAFSLILTSTSPHQGDTETMVRVCTSTLNHLIWCKACNEFILNTIVRVLYNITPFQQTL